MSLTDVFFVLALIISAFFAFCTVGFFILHLVIYHRINKNFKAVEKDD
ncbi:hypothetical protein [Liquorilactobacillus sucicola]|nr:hypothetical protein [Liquorilactobacillus sucicola]